MALPAEKTLLLLDGMGVPLYSARGLDQKWQQIAQALMPERDVDGGLIDMLAVQFKKYRTIITCADLRMPGLFGVWPGSLVTIHCIFEFNYPAGGAPERTPVAGSEITTEGNFVHYRPILACRVFRIEGAKNEYGVKAPWTLEAEEV